jgi:hypothetical protein
LDLNPGGPNVAVAHIELCGTAATSSELTQLLPFDLQQRYCLAGEIVRIMAPGSLLDVGGYLGDRYGHLATTQDFLTVPNGAKIRVATTDIRQCDHPCHQPCPADDQPFKANSFDMVISLDVLEHIPPQAREKYMRELDRVAARFILLGAPFHSSSIEELEKTLASQLELRFLEEHLQYGLPRHEEVEDFYLHQRGYSIKAFPNGYLPTWGAFQILTQLLFSWQNHRAVQGLNALYREHIYPKDQREPAYRTIYLISKRSILTNQLLRLDRLLSPEGDIVLGLLFNPKCMSLFQALLSTQLARAKVLSDTQFLINERQKGIEILSEQLQEVQGMPLWRIALKRLHQLVKRRSRP